MADPAPDPTPTPDPAPAPITAAPGTLEWVKQLRAANAGSSEDYARFSDAEIRAWAKWFDPSTGKFKNNYGDPVDKPDERGPNTPPDRNGTGDQGNYGQGQNGPGGGGDGNNGVPKFDYKDFVPPTYESAMADPGYQFALKEGLGSMEKSAAAKGVLRTSGTLKDMMQWGQGAAAQQYGDVYNRALQTFGTNYGIAKDVFAPQYGSWQTIYGGNLQKYLNKENNIYGLLNQPPPTPPVWS